MIYAKSTIVLLCVIIRLNLFNMFTPIYTTPPKVNINCSIYKLLKNLFAFVLFTCLLTSINIIINAVAKVPQVTKYFV